MGTSWMDDGFWTSESGLRDMLGGGYHLPEGALMQDGHIIDADPCLWALHAQRAPNLGVEGRHTR